MGFVLTLIYISLSFLSPADMFPALTPYRILLVLAIIAVVASFPVLIGTRVTGLAWQQFVVTTMFLGWVLCSWLPHGWLGGGLRSMRIFLPEVAVYYLALLHLRGANRLKVLRVVLVLTTLFILANGIPRYYGPLRSLETQPYLFVHEEITGISKRLQGLGILADPNQFAQQLLILIPLLYVSSEVQPRSTRYLVAVPLTLLFLWGVLLTHSRGGLLGMLLVIGLYLRKRWKHAGAMVSAAGALGVLAFVNLGGGRAISIAGGVDRLMLWSDGIGQFRHSPIWGIGHLAFVDAVGMTAHNSFLLCATELGFVGLVLWMGMIVLSFCYLHAVTSFPLSPKMPGYEESLVVRRWAEALKLSLAAYLFTGYFLSCTYRMPLYMLVGMSGAIYCIEAQKYGKENMPIYNGWAKLSVALSVGVLMAIYLSVRMRTI